MVVAAIYENHIGLGVRESARGGNPAEARADDHDALSRAKPIRGTRQSRAFRGQRSFRGSCSNILQCIAHCLASSGSGALVKKLRASALEPRSSRRGGALDLLAQFEQAQQDFVTLGLELGD